MLLFFSIVVGVERFDDCKSPIWFFHYYKQSIAVLSIWPSRIYFLQPCRVCLLITCTCTAIFSSQYTFKEEQRSSQSGYNQSRANPNRRSRGFWRTYFRRQSTRPSDRRRWGRRQGRRWPQRNRSWARLLGIVWARIVAHCWIGCRRINPRHRARRCWCKRRYRPAWRLELVVD